MAVGAGRAASATAAVNQARSTGEPARETPKPTNWLLHTLGIIGVLGAGLFLVDRVFEIGMSNSWLWGTKPSDPIDARTDTTIWVETTILTLATTALIVLTVRGARKHGKVSPAGVTYAVIGCILAAFMWFGIIDLLQ